MDKKVIIAIAAVAVAIMIAVPVAIVLANNSNNKETSTPEARLLIYGNANNDDYLDQKDVDFIQDIIDGKTKWDRTANQFADTNHDGYISQDDITVLKKFINHENGEKMYYINAKGDLASINYPLDRHIGVRHVYPIDACVILGVYENVMGASANVFDNNMAKDQKKYPGLLERCENVGSPNTDPEALLSSHVKTFLTHSWGSYPGLESAIASGTTDVQLVQLNMSSRDPRGADRLGSLLMLGTMLQLEEKAHAYVDWVDEIVDYIEQKSFQVTEYLAPLTSSTETQAKLDCSFSDGYMFGEIYTLSIINFKDVYIPVDDTHACPFISYETVYKINPEFIFQILFNDFTDSVEDTQSIFESHITKYKGTQAYANKKVYGFNYYSMGTYFGFAQLALLCAYLYPDTYSMEKGWEYTQYYYDHFTNYKDVDVKTLGGAGIYAMK